MRLTLRKYQTLVSTGNSHSFLVFYCLLYESDCRVKDNYLFLSRYEYPDRYTSDQPIKESC